MRWCARCCLVMCVHAAAAYDGSSGGCGVGALVFAVLYMSEQTCCL